MTQDQAALLAMLRLAEPKHVRISGIDEVYEEAFEAGGRDAEIIEERLRWFLRLPGHEEWGR